MTGGRWSVIATMYSVLKQLYHLWSNQELQWLHKSVIFWIFWRSSCVHFFFFSKFTFFFFYFVYFFSQFTAIILYLPFLSLLLNWITSTNRLIHALYSRQFEFQHYTRINWGSLSTPWSEEAHIYSKNNIAIHAMRVISLNANKLNYVLSAHVCPYFDFSKVAVILL